MSEELMKGKEVFFRLGVVIVIAAISALLVISAATPVYNPGAKVRVKTMNLELEVIQCNSSTCTVKANEYTIHVLDIAVLEEIK